EERLFVLLGLDALLRLGDVRRLRLEHDLGTALAVVDPKTQPYTVPISSRLRRALDAMRPIAEHRGGYFFARTHYKRGPDKGKWRPIAENTAFRLWEDLCRRAGVLRGRNKGGVTYHSLRHTGATRAARVTKLTNVKRLGG